MSRSVSPWNGRTARSWPPSRTAGRMAGPSSAASMTAFTPDGYSERTAAAIPAPRSTT